LSLPSHASAGLAELLEPLLSETVLPNSLPQPVKHWWQIALLVGGVVQNYVDIGFDSFVMVVYFSREEFGYFSLALAFVAIPYLLYAGSMLPNFSDFFSALFMLQAATESRKSLQTGVQSSRLIHLKLLETVVEGCPSALLQFFVLLRRAIDKKTPLIVHLSDIAVVVSLCLSKVFTSMCLGAYTSNKEQLEQIKKFYPDNFSDFFVSKVLLTLYHLASEIFRLTTVCGMMLSLKSYGFLSLISALPLRSLLVFSLEAEDPEKETLKVISRLLMSLESDTLWCANRRLTVALQLVTALEGVVFVLISLLVSSSRYQRDLAWISLGAWVFKCLFYYVTYFQVRQPSERQDDRPPQTSFASDRLESGENILHLPPLREPLLEDGYESKGG
jgi:hypothetical protein